MLGLAAEATRTGTKGVHARGLGDFAGLTRERVGGLPATGVELAMWGCTR